MIYHHASSLALEQLDAGARDLLLAWRANHPTQPSPD